MIVTDFLLSWNTYSIDVTSWNIEFLTGRIEELARNVIFEGNNCAIGKDQVEVFAVFIGKTSQVHVLGLNILWYWNFTNLMLSVVLKVPSDQVQTSIIIIYNYKLHKILKSSCVYAIDPNIST